MGAVETTAVIFTKMKTGESSKQPQNVSILQVCLQLNCFSMDFVNLIPFVFRVFTALYTRTLLLTLILVFI